MRKSRAGSCSRHEKHKHMVCVCVCVYIYIYIYIYIHIYISKDKNTHTLEAHLRRECPELVVAQIERPHLGQILQLGGQCCELIAEGLQSDKIR